MECQTALDQVKQLQQEGFTEDMIRQLLPKLEQVSTLKEEERHELKHRMEQLLPEVANAKTTPIQEAEVISTGCIPVSAVRLWRF